MQPVHLQQKSVWSGVAFKRQISFKRRKRRGIRETGRNTGKNWINCRPSAPPAEITADSARSAGAKHRQKHLARLLKRVQVMGFLRSRHFWARKRRIAILTIATFLALC